MARALFNHIKDYVNPLELQIILSIVISQMPFCHPESIVTAFFHCAVTMTVQNPHRQQLLALKKSLNESLGEMWNDYWQNLTQFLQQSITKQQLDSNLLYLSPSQQKLHNRFILSIISNCMNSELVTATEITVLSKSRSSDCKHYQNRFNSRIMANMSIEEKERLLQLENIQKEDPEVEDFEFKGVDGIPKTCVEERDLPTQEQLRSRLKFISAFQDINPSFGNEVVNLLNDAMYVYLKG